MGQSGATWIIVTMLHDMSSKNFRLEPNPRIENIHLTEYATFGEDNPTIFCCKSNVVLLHSPIPITLELIPSNPK